MVQVISTVVLGVNPDWRLLFRLGVTKPKTHMHLSSATSLLADSLLGFWASSDFSALDKVPRKSLGAAQGAVHAWR